MRIHELGLRSVALLLVVLLTVHTMPLSAAEGTSRATSIGQVSANGAVDLRGVHISGDGTLFSGDRMNVGSGAYAKVALGAGPKLEVGAGSDVTVSREAEDVQVKMASGNVAFKGGGKSPIHLHVGAYEVLVPGNASGNVAYVGKNAFEVRVLTGSVSVRNGLTKQSFSVQKGTERLISLQTGDINQPLARLASSSPSSVPALPQTAQGSGLSRSGWIAVIGTIAGATAAVIVLTTRNDDTDDDAATRLAQVKAIQNLNAIAASATATNTLATNVSASASAAVTIIAASTASAAVKASLTASANAIIARANSAIARIATLNTQIAALQNTIANQEGAPTAAQTAQLNQLIADLNAAIADANGALADLKALATTAAANGVIIPQPTFTPVSGPVIASASIPV